MNSDVVFKRIVIVSLAALFAMNFALLSHMKPLNNSSTTTVYRTEQGLPGPIGQTGAQGLQGLSMQGQNGKDGETITNTLLQPVNVVGAAGETGAGGEAGEQGQPGTDGRTLEQRANPANGDFQQKYTDEEYWHTLYYLCDGKFEIQRCSDAS